MFQISIGCVFETESFEEELYFMEINEIKVASL